MELEQSLLQVVEPESLLLDICSTAAPLAMGAVTSESGRKVLVWFGCGWQQVVPELLCHIWGGIPTLV